MSPLVPPQGHMPRARAPATLPPATAKVRSLPLCHSDHTSPLQSRQLGTALTPAPAWWDPGGCPRLCPPPRLHFSESGQPSASSAALCEEPGGWDCHSHRSHHRPPRPCPPLPAPARSAPQPCKCGGRLFCCCCRCYRPLLPKQGFTWARGLGVGVHGQELHLPQAPGSRGEATRPRSASWSPVHSQAGLPGDRPC